MPSSRKPNEHDLRIARELKALRKARGMSQFELGNVLGKSAQQISKYERGIDRWSRGDVDRALEFLNATAEERTGFAEPAVAYLSEAVQKAQKEMLKTELEGCVQRILGELKAIREIVARL